MSDDWSVDIGGTLDYAKLAVTAININLAESSELSGEFIVIAKEPGKNLGPVPFKITNPSETSQKALKDFFGAIASQIVLNALPVTDRETAEQIDSGKEARPIKKLGE